MTLPGDSRRGHFACYPGRMTIVMEPVVDQLYAEAQRKAAANPPGRVLATIILSVFTALGFIVGTLWTGVWFCAMAFMYGVKKGTTAIPAKPQPAPA